MRESGEGVRNSGRVGREGGRVREWGESEIEVKWEGELGRIVGRKNGKVGKGKE